MRKYLLNTLSYLNITTEPHKVLYNIYLKSSKKSNNNIKITAALLLSFSSYSLESKFETYSKT